MADGPIPFEIVDLVEDRLRERLAGFEMLDGTVTDVPILRVESVERLDRNQPLQVSVISAGFQIDEQTSRQVAVQESVVCVVAVRDPSTQIGGAGAMRESGPLLLAVFSSLFRWSPDDRYEPLTMIDATGAQHEAGFGYYPIAFQTRYVLGA